MFRADRKVADHGIYKRRKKAQTKSGPNDSKRGTPSNSMVHTELNTWTARNTLSYAERDSLLVFKLITKCKHSAKRQHGMGMDTEDVARMGIDESEFKMELK